MTIQDHPFFGGWISDLVNLARSQFVQRMVRVGSRLDRENAS